MNSRDRERQDILTRYEKELAELDSNRVSLGEVGYWKKYKEISANYNRILNDFESKGRVQISLDKSKSSSNKRPEYTYSDVAHQLKTEKIADLVAQLVSIDSKYRDRQIDPSDPFYEDKKNPLDVFERWWNEELDKLPSILQIRNFLSRISINEFGYIVYDFDSPDKFTEESLNNEAKEQSERLKAALSERVKRRNKIRKEQARKKLLNKYPLRAKHIDKLESQRKQDLRESKDVAKANILYAIVDAYTLPEDLCDLLYEHIDKVCIPKGLTHVDEYQPMLEQFLRFVQDPQERLAVVDKSIRKGWRVLSNGLF